MSKSTFERHGVTEAVFEGPNFSITHLSPEGLEVETRNSVRRSLSDEERHEMFKIRDGLKWRKGKNFFVRVGLKLVERASSGGKLELNIEPVTYPAYKAEVSNLAGTAIILETTEPDGKHKILLQDKGAKNERYAGTIGASVGRLFTAQLLRYPQGDRAHRGTLAPIDHTSIRQNILDGAQHELKLEANDIQDVRIVGLANHANNDEFLLHGKTNLSAIEIARRVGQGGEGDFNRFTEQFTAIDATPKAIATLLTKVRCPIPPTHAAALVASGYSMVFNTLGSAPARLWLQRMKSGMEKNTRGINESVQRFHAKNAREPEQFPTGDFQNMLSYDARVPRDKQGLPSALEALTAARLKTGL